MPLENSQVLGFPLQVLGSTCTAKVCKTIAFMALLGVWGYYLTYFWSLGTGSMKLYFVGEVLQT